MDGRIRWAVIIIGLYALFAIVGNMVIVAKERADLKEHTRLLEVRTDAAHRFLQSKRFTPSSELSDDSAYAEADRALRLNEAQSSGWLSSSIYSPLAWKGGVVLVLAFGIGAAIFTRPKRD